MGFTSQQAERLELEHEPGSWIMLRPVPGWAKLRAASFTAADPERSTLIMLTAAITGWSYDVPITEEAVQDLDEDTLLLVMGRVFPGLNTTPEDAEGKGSRASARSRRP